MELIADESQNAFIARTDEFALFSAAISPQEIKKASTNMASLEPHHIAETWMMRIQRYCLIRLTIFCAVAALVLAERMTFAASFDIPLDMPPLDKLERVTPRPIPSSALETQPICSSTLQTNQVGSAPRQADLAQEVFVNPNDVESYLDPWGWVKIGGVVLKQRLTSGGVVESYLGIRKRSAGYFPAAW